MGPAWGLWEGREATDLVNSCFSLEVGGREEGSHSQMNLSPEGPGHLQQGDLKSPKS